MVDSLYLPFLTLLFHISGIGWITFCSSKLVNHGQLRDTIDQQISKYLFQRTPLLGFAESTGTNTLCPDIPKAFPT